MSIDRDNPKWTAYVLGELEAGERAALESELESSEEAREFVQELRLAASMMKDGLALHANATLTPEQRFSIQAASSARPAKPWFERPSHGPGDWRQPPCCLRRYRFLRSCDPVRFQRSRW
jgi:anti-sigma factor RsiW